MASETGAPASVGEMIDEGRSKGIKAITIGVAAAFLLGALVYTGIHNYNLFSKFLPPEQRVFALIPVVLIEGSIIMFLVGSFVWFGYGAQKTLAATFGWMLFGIAAANTLIDSMYAQAETAPAWLAVYAQFFVPITPVIVAAMWKIIFDTDPAKKERDFKMATAGAIREAKHEARVRALRGGMNVQALADYGRWFDEALAAEIRKSAPVIDGTARPVEPVVKLAADAPSPSPHPEGAGDGAPAAWRVGDKWHWQAGVQSGVADSLDAAKAAAIAARSSPSPSPDGRGSEEDGPKT